MELCKSPPSVRCLKDDTAQSLDASHLSFSKWLNFCTFAPEYVQLLGMMVSEDRDIQCNPLFPKDTQ